MPRHGIPKGPGLFKPKGLQNTHLTLSCLLHSNSTYGTHVCRKVREDSEEADKSCDFSNMNG